MYDATALTTPAPAKGPHFRAVYDTPTSAFMLNLATNQAELQDTNPQAFRFKLLFSALGWRAGGRCRRPAEPRAVSESHLLREAGLDW